VVERFLDKMHKCQMKAITALVKDIITGISTGNNGKCSLAVAKYFGIVV
jgi:hypothetical protein